MPSCVVVYCDVEAVPPDAVSVDGLARLQLTARRCGYELRLRGVSNELRELIELMGLREVLGEGPAAGSTLGG